ncbi:MAG: hypothetical protein HY020_19010 [Burkholderiales bacterium]|nr:hypothetical protein [Burkholderiales bacterium]
MKRRPVFCRSVLPALLWALVSAPPAGAASATAQAGAAVIEPVTVVAWLGVPISVQDLLLALDASAGPATGARVARVPGASPPASLRALPLWIAGALEARQAFGIDMVAAAATALLPRGPAAAVSAAATGGDGEGPLIVTVAFN